MADYRGECCSDITLKNLICSVQITEVVRIFAKKVVKEHPLR